MEIDRFIEDNIIDIEKNNFGIVYFRAKQQLDRVSDLTKILFQAGIEPLQGTDIIPDGYLLRMKVSDFQIPENIERIGKSAFAISSIERIKIPQNVKTLGTHLFQGCVDLKEVIFDEPCQIKILPYHCFTSCIQIRDIYLPDSIREIDRFCFSECDELETVSLGQNISRISDSVFTDCPKLKTIKFRGTSEQWKDIFLADMIFDLDRKYDMKVECNDKTINFYENIIKI